MNKYKVSVTGCFVAESEQDAIDQFQDMLAGSDVLTNSVEGVCLTCSHPIEQHQEDGDGPCIALFCVCDVFHYNIGDCPPECWGAE